MSELDPRPALAGLAGRIASEGYAFVPGAELRALLGGEPADWESFAASWN